MKISKLDRRLIAQIAKTLPAMQHSDQSVKQIIHGSAVLMRDPDTTLGNKGIEPIKANKKYIGGDVPKDVNHRKELEKMFIKFGDVGLATYQKQVLLAANK